MSEEQLMHKIFLLVTLETRSEENNAIFKHFLRFNVVFQK